MSQEPKPILNVSTPCPTPSASFICVDGLDPRDVRLVDDVVSFLRGGTGGRLVRDRIYNALITASELRDERPRARELAMEQVDRCRAELAAAEQSNPKADPRG